MTEVDDPGREGAVKSSRQVVLEVFLGIAVVTSACTQASHTNRPGLIMLVAVPLISAGWLETRTAVGFSAICAVLVFVLPGTLWATNTVHFVRLSAITATCAASAVAAFWRGRLTTTRALYEGVRTSATDCLLHGWQQPVTFEPGEVCGGLSGAGAQHQRAASLLEVARFDGEALEMALEQSDLQRAQWLARGLLGTWIEVVDLLGSSATSI